MRLTLQAVLVAAVAVLSVSTARADSGKAVSRAARLARQLPQATVTVTDRLITQVNGPSLATGPTARESQDAFLNTHAATLGVSIGHLRVEGSLPIMDGKFTLFAYRQEVGGIPVYDRWLKLLVRNEPDHPLVLVNSSLNVLPDLPHQPNINKAVALASARQAEPTAVNFTIPHLVYYPTGPDNVTLAWRFYGDNGGNDGFDRWEFFVDAVTGELVDQRPGLYHVDILGNITGYQSPVPYPDQGNNMAGELPVWGARVRVGTGTPTYTDENGDFVLPHSGTDPVTVTVDFVGQWANVTNASSGGLVTGSQVATPPGPVDITLNPSPTQFLNSQVNAITQLSRVHDFVKSLIPGFTGFDVQINTRVNNTYDTCNAFYAPGSPPSLDFFHKQVGGCPNTAYTSIIYHEYGHFVVDASPGGPDTSDYHEGMSDVTTALLLNDPCVGHDWYGQDTSCLRDIDTSDTQYPCTGDEHDCGQVIGGAFWDMRTELIATEGSQVGLELARDFYIGQLFSGNHRIHPSVTTDILTLDDDDGDITNGTPHLDEICTGFEAHNLTCPDLVYMTFDYPNGRPQLVTPESQATIRVNVNAHAGLPIPGTGTVSYRLGSSGSFTTVSMTELSDNQYEATLPAAACGETIEYYFSADSYEDGTASDPPESPTVRFATVSASALVNILSYDFETDPGWTVTNSDPFGDGAWDRGTPAGGGDRGDPPFDYDGSGQCFLTDNVDGDSDVDNGTTTLTSPVLDVTGLVDPRVSYARWYYNGDENGGLEDIFEVEVSDDGGSIWENLETVGPTGSQVSGGWIVSDFRIADSFPVTSQFRIRFLASDLVNSSIVEAGLDAFQINDVVCCQGNPDCDDGVYCNGAEECVANDCQAGSDPCTDPAYPICDESGDSCVECLVNDDCDDGLYCNGAETCAGNVCQAGTDPCDDAVGCSVDSCNEVTDTCGHLPDNGLCDDGAYCNGQETCHVTADCQAGTEPCDDGVACTIDTCDEGADTCTGNTPDDGFCDDGAYCNGAEICDSILGCQSGADPCDDGVACTIDTCDEGTDTCTGNTPNDVLCDDGAYCNGAEICDSILGCQPGTDACDDGVPCTIDSCDEGTDTCTGNTPDNGLCDDGVYCNGAETCDTVFDCQSGTDPCDDGVGCTIDSCSEATDSCTNTPEDTLCDDGLYCNGTEICDDITDCQSGPDPCDDQVACTIDSCNELADICTNTADDGLCDDTQYCNGLETCHALLDCQTGTPPDCDDAVGCTVDSCNELADTCINAPDDVLCDDGLFCSGTETCHVTLDCLPGSYPCTDPLLPACNEAADLCTVSCAIDSDCDDGVLCTVDECQETFWGCTNDWFRYGDVDHNGAISIFDLFCILNGFGGVFTDCTFEDDDITGNGNHPADCGPNGSVNIFDLFAVLNAFSGDDPCCEETVGACCTTDSSCIYVEQVSECQDYGGLFLGMGSDCFTDSDADGILDTYETNTGVLNLPCDTGTDPNNPDTDGDGINDGDEVFGTAAGVDLPGMGADPFHTDIFVEIDWIEDDFDDTDLHTHRPSANAIQAIVDAFAAAPVANPDGATGINLHVDYGQGGPFIGGNLIPGGWSFIVFDGGFNGFKSANFTTGRGGYFHYAIFTHRHDSVDNDRSGIAEIGGDDFMVTLPYTPQDDGFVSKTFMHMLGHNLGFRHGGGDDVDDKPNYNSVMNSRFQFDGIDGTDCDSAGNDIPDYSIGARIDLDETALDEFAGVCGDIGIDWDGGGQASGVWQNINCLTGRTTDCGTGHDDCYDSICTILSDYDDWANVVVGSPTAGDPPTPVSTCREGPIAP